MDCGNSRVGGALGSIERGGNALVSRIGIAVSNSRGATGTAVGVDRLFDPRHSWRVGVGFVFAKGIATLRPRCKALPLWTQYFQPAVAGLLIGIIALLGAPQVMGAGYEAIDEAMHGRLRGNSWRYWQD